MRISYECVWRDVKWSIMIYYEVIWGIPSSGRNDAYFGKKWYFFQLMLHVRCIPNVFQFLHMYHGAWGAVGRERKEYSIPTSYSHCSAARGRGPPRLARTEYGQSHRLVTQPEPQSLWWYYEPDKDQKQHKVTAHTAVWVSRRKAGGLLHLQLYAHGVDRDRGCR